MKRPPQLTPESLTKAFMELTYERFPAADKVLRLAKQLGIEGNIPAQIVVFSKFRDAVRQVSKDYIFRSIQHRDDVFSAVIEALEELEGRLEEEEEASMRVELEQAKRADNRPSSQESNQKT